ncbi:uncharacterized protein HKW66_Vig0050930 [Vigna angularis]|uniref:Uncharacterized protein n=1 Tax=Phaseolus angularis TaxID=3914 RepID=A0A8T0L4F7_PHAAN|nr:uncharacterized protein HKW66_Vig0050930 [Vigna angularis]
MENDEHSSVRLQAPLEVPARSTLIKSLKKTTSDHRSVNHKQFEATVQDFKPEMAESERPRRDSGELADSTESILTRSRAPRVPKPPPRPSLSSSSMRSQYTDSTASENGNVEIEKVISRPPPPPPPPFKAALKAAPPPPPPPSKGMNYVQVNTPLMRRESQSRRESLSGVVELPPAPNPRDMIGEIENRSSHLLAREKMTAQLLEWERERVLKVERKG